MASEWGAIDHPVFFQDLRLLLAVDVPHLLRHARLSIGNQFRLRPVGDFPEVVRRLPDFPIRILYVLHALVRHRVRPENHPGLRNLRSPLFLELHVFPFLRDHVKRRDHPALRQLRHRHLPMAGPAVIEHQQERRRAVVLPAGDLGIPHRRIHLTAASRGQHQSHPVFLH
jgi:hypothetical protein